MNETITLAEAAVAVGKPEEDLLAAVKAGQLSASKVAGTYYVTRSELAKWLSRPVPATDGFAARLAALEQTVAEMKAAAVPKPPAMPTEPPKRGGKS